MRISACLKICSVGKFKAGGRRKAHLNPGKFNPGEEPVRGREGIGSVKEWLQNKRVGAAGRSANGWSDKSGKHDLSRTRSSASPGLDQGAGKRKVRRSGSSGGLVD